MNILLLSIVLVIELVTIYFILSQRKKSKRTHAVTTTTIRHRIKEASILSVTECTVKKMIVVEKDAKIKAFNRVMVFSVNASMKAGIVLEKMNESDIKTSDNNIDIYLPHAERTESIFHNDTWKEEYCHAGIFMRRRPSLPTQHEEMANAQNEIESEKFLKNSGILSEAENTAERYIRSILSNIGLEESKVNIHFK